MDKETNLGNYVVLAQNKRIYNILINMKDWLVIEDIHKKSGIKKEAIKKHLLHLMFLNLIEKKNIKGKTRYKISPFI